MTLQLIGHEVAGEPQPTERSVTVVRVQDQLSDATDGSSRTVIAKVEWMPLGTFAVTKDPKDADPTNVMQLAVSKEEQEEGL